MISRYASTTSEAESVCAMVSMNYGLWPTSATFDAAALFLSGKIDSAELWIGMEKKNYFTTIEPSQCLTIRPINISDYLQWTSNRSQAVPNFATDSNSHRAYFQTCSHTKIYLYFNRSEGRLNFADTNRDSRKRILCFTEACEFKKIEYLKFSCYVKMV